MAIKTGRKEKDAQIKEGFNPDKKMVMTKAQLAKVKKQAKIDAVTAEMERMKRERALERLGDQIGMLREKVSTPIVHIEQEPPEPEPLLSNEKSEKSAYQMLEDLRYAYRNSRGDTGKKGKQRLVELMEKDAEFKFMVKELVKVEASLLSAKIRTKEDVSVTANNMVYVVLKGLEEEKEVMKQISGIDMRQVTDALNPDAVRYEVDEREATQLAGQDAPEGW